MQSKSIYFYVAAQHNKKEAIILQNIVFRVIKTDFS